jgi:hypothetical protein
VGREARVQEGRVRALMRRRARDVIAPGCIKYRECTKVHFSAALCVYIYIHTQRQSMEACIDMVVTFCCSSFSLGPFYQIDTRC